MELNRWQKRFWVDALTNQSSAAHVGLLFTVKGKLEVDLLQKALRETAGEFLPLHAVCKEREDKVVLEACPVERLQTGFRWGNEMGEEDWEEFGLRPFDLRKELPFKVLVVQYGAETFRVGFIFHHICMDLVSITDFWKVLSSKYAVFRSGQLPKREIVPDLQDYMDWEKEYFRKNSYQEGLKYWQQFISGIPSFLAFSKISGKRQGNFVFRLGERLVQAVHKRADVLHTTPFRIFMSAWLWSLAVFSGSRQVSVSYAVNLRPGKFRGMAGPFVNNLPCGVNLEENPSFEQTVYECSRQRHESHRFEYVSISDVLEYMYRNGRLRADEPFLNTAVNYVAWGPSQRLELQGTTTVFERRIQTDSYFDLTLEIEPESPGYCRIVYAAGFPKELIYNIQRFWVRTLILGCRNPAVCFSDIPVMTRVEIEKMRCRAGEPVVKNSSGFIHFLTAFRRIVKFQGERTALLLGGEKVSYQQLDSWSDRVAYAVKQECGGLPVGICLERDCNYPAVILGVMKAGVAYVPLESTSPVARLNFMVKDCGIRCVIIQRRIAGRLDCVCELYIEDLLSPVGSVTEIPLPLGDARDTAYIIYTSGTTGKPKGVPISHGNLSCFIRNALAVFRLRPVSVQLQYANLAFDASVMEIFPPLSCGATLCLASEEERKDPEKLGALMRKEKVSSAYIAPAMLALLRAELPGLKTLFVGGESTPSAVLKKWQRGRRLLNLYGPTETTVFITYCEVSGRTAANDIGRMVKGTYGYVLDEYGRFLPAYVPGELCVGGLQLSCGYLNREELNREKFILKELGKNKIRLYKTGDRVILLPNRHFLFEGRMDSQIKIRGLRIELGEIEDSLNRLQGIRQALAVVKERGTLKQIVAYVCPEHGGEADISFWKEQLGRSLPAYMIPDVFVIMENFPRTPNGKTDRKQLPEPEWQEKEYVSPVSFAEKLLAEKVAQILGIERVSVGEDLFLLGLSSLTAVHLSSEMMRCGLSVPVATIYHERTIRKIAGAGRPRVVRWFTEYREGLPVVVLVCGHMDFSSVLYSLADMLKPEYTVLVIESFHDYSDRLPEGTDFAGLVCWYEHILTETLPEGVGIYAFTGHCLGGEIAYALAIQWALHHVGRPEVWMFNSLAQRNLPVGWNRTLPLSSAEEKMFWELVVKKQKVADQMIATIILPVYRGRVLLFIASEFTACLAGPDLPALADLVIIRMMKDTYTRNPDCWKKLAPHLEVYRLPGNHWTMLREETLRSITFDQTEN